MNILLVAYETETFSLTHVANHLENLGHTPKILIGDPTHIMNETDIVDYIQRHGFDKWSAFDDEYEKLYETDHEVDWDYLRRFENEYCRSKNLNQLVLTDPIVARYHHFRDPYYTPTKSEQTQYYWVELLLRWVEREINRFEPDLIFNYRRNYLVKNAVAQIALSRDIPIRTLIHSRIGSLYYLCTNFGLGTDPRVAEYVKTADDDCEDARRYISEFAEDEGSGGLYESRSQKKTERDRLYSVRQVARDFASTTKQILTGTLRGQKKTFGSRTQGNLFDSYIPAILSHYARISANRLRYRYSDPFATQIPDREFIYFPLHTIPESATLTLSTAYFETDIIRHVANKLPAGMVLCVKENPNMIGEHPWRFYAEIETIPNVRLLDPTVSSKQLIEDSRGVAGISGTALLEAGVLNTPSHAFGEPEFVAFVDSTGWDDFDEFARRCTRGASAMYTDKIKKYIQYVFDNGVELDMDRVRNEPGSNEFEQGVETVNRLLESVCQEVVTGDTAETPAES